MKKFLILCLCSVLSLVFIPPAVYNAGRAAEEPKTAEELHSDFAAPEFRSSADGTINVFLADAGVSREMNFRDYVIGAAAGEMPAEFEYNALCAQALACATYARRLSRLGGSEKLGGAVISTSPAVHQAFIDKARMKKLWGGDFDKYYSKIAKAVDEVINYEIVYNGEPIEAVFHAISPGRTESAENIWQDKIPYLVSVESEGDSFSPRFASELRLSADDFAEKIKAEGASLPENREEWLSSPEYSEAGTLMKISIGGKSFSGTQLRRIFSLRSAAVKLCLDGEDVVFSVKGYGHGVGMSQYGADYYARQGKSWREIIEHYYPGTEIRRVSAD